MRVAILTFDGFNELDSLVAFGILNRKRPGGKGPGHLTRCLEPATAG